MADDDPDDDGFDLDTNLAAISDLKHVEPAAPVLAPVEQKTIGDDTLRTPEEIRASYGYKLIEAQVAATMAQYQPRTIEEKFYGSKK